jgi:hypothetical protein
VLAAVVAPNVHARRVGGSPIPAAVAGPPSIGNCVIDMTDPWPPRAEPGFAVGDAIEFPTAHFGPCVGPTVGEVASIDTGAAPPERIVDNAYQVSVSQCSLDAIGYLGSIPPLVDRGLGQPGIVWTSVLAFRYTSIGPTAVQRAAGQRWSACAVGSAGMTPYVGRLRSVLSGGDLPPVFGSCLAAIDLSGAAQIGCDAPHQVELLGWTSLSSTPVSAVEARDACAVYAGRALRTADPTRNGAIRLEILDATAATAIPPITANLADSYLACAAIENTGHQFDNTLIGIGERPLPLA